MGKADPPSSRFFFPNMSSFSFKIYLYIFFLFSEWSSKWRKQPEKEGSLWVTAVRGATDRH